jgi:uncharacterized protein
MLCVVPVTERGGRSMSPLTEQECRRLLGTVAVGRLGLTEGALPVIVPVRFTVSGDAEVVVHATERVMTNVGSGAIVAFEADDWDSPSGPGWSVSAVGPCRRVIDPQRIADLDRRGFAGTAPAGGYLAVQLTRVRGEALDRSPTGSADSWPGRGPAEAPATGGRRPDRPA